MLSTSSRVSSGRALRSTRLQRVTHQSMRCFSAVEQVAEVSYTSDALPPPFVGPIAIAQVKGKGRGVMTTRPVMAGELLMVDIALGILQYPQHAAGNLKPLVANDLVDHMLEQRFTTNQLNALDLLYDGSERTVSAEASQQLKKMLYAAEDRPAEPEVQAPAASTSGTPTDPDRPTLPRRAPMHLGRRRLQSLVELNSWGLPLEDVAACRVRGQASQAHLGLWPMFSLVNHSCAPNASPMVLGDRMILRATTPIAGGAEVCINYAGVIALSPLEVRQGMLERNHKFLCHCGRCSLEQRLAPYVGDIWLTVFEAVVRQVQPHVKAAVENGDMASAQAAQQQLHSYVMLTDDIMGQLCKELKLSRHAEMLLRASLYVVPENLENMDLCSLGEEADTPCLPRELEHLATCVQLSALVCGGSEHHTNLAVRYLARARERWGDAHPKSKEAQEELLRAFRARYGNVPSAVMQRLVLASQAPNSKPLLLRF